MNKELFITFLIVLAILAGTVLSIKLLPVYVTLIAGVAGLLGITAGWYAKKMYDKYFKKN